MRKLDLKTKWIRGAKVDFFKEGLYRGTLGIEIEMSGDAALGSFDDVVRAVKVLKETRMPTVKVVRFTGSLVEHDPNFNLLVKSLYDYGFELQCVIGDNMVYSWLQWMGWIVIRTPRPVAMMMCDELWYVPEELDKTKDVSYPVKPGRPTFCFLGGRVSMDDADEFVCSSRSKWALL